MELRDQGRRVRDLANDQSLRNPLYLQMKTVVEEVAGYFSTLPQKGLTIYDLGCGAKPYKSFSGDNSYVGVDIDKSNVDADIFANIDNVPADDDIADVVCSFFVLEHVYNPSAVLAEKFRLLKPGGEALMLVPLYWEEHEQPHDYWRFTQFSLRRMLEEAKFIDIAIKPLSANWAIFGMHVARLLHSRVTTRWLVPVVNRVFFALDKRRLAMTEPPSNVMSYAVRARKAAA